MSSRPSETAARSRPSMAWGTALAFAFLAGSPASAQIAAPGDVYYQVHVNQRFKYYVFVQDEVTWLDADYIGTSLSESAVHDTTMSQGLVGVAADFAADAGTFTADTDTHIDVDARTGIFHRMTNTLTVSVYIKGGTGTPYWITSSGSGLVEVWRLGGTPGTLQPVNGTSFAAFMDSSASVNYSGVLAVPVEESSVLSGTTTGQIVVGADTYSLAHTYTFAQPAEVTQALCVLGCMGTAAHFHAQAAGHVELHVYPYAAPTGVPALAGAGPVTLQASPNPLRDATTVSFRAPAGQRTTVRVFDVRGRLLSALYDATATGGLQRVPWEATGVPGGLYFVRVETGARTSTAKLALVK